jgi:hypothetical protein
MSETRCDLCGALLEVEVDGKRFVSAEHDAGSVTSIPIRCLTDARARISKLTNDLADRQATLEAMRERLALLLDNLRGTTCETWGEEVAAILSLEASA